MMPAPQRQAVLVGKSRDVVRMGAIRNETNDRAALSGRPEDRRPGNCVEAIQSTPG